MSDELMTINDMIKFLKISRSKAYELVNTKGFPVIKFGRNIRIRKTDLNNWLNTFYNHDIFNDELESGKGDF